MKLNSGRRLLATVDIPQSTYLVLWSRNLFLESYSLTSVFAMILPPYRSCTTYLALWSRNRFLESYSLPSVFAMILPPYRSCSWIFTRTLLVCLTHFWRSKTLRCMLMQLTIGSQPKFGEMTSDEAFNETYYTTFTGSVANFSSIEYVCIANSTT